MNIRKKWWVAVSLLTVGLFLVACNGSPGNGLAKVNQVEVVTAPGNPPRYVAVASGILPDGCTRLGRSRQRVVATTIRVTLPTEPAEGACSQLATVPFEETIRLRVNGLSAGSYTVEVNGAAASFLLAEDH